MSSGCATAAHAAAHNSGSDSFFGAHSQGTSSTPFESGGVNEGGTHGAVCPVPSVEERVAARWDSGAGSSGASGAGEHAESLFGHYSDAKPANQSRPHQDAPVGILGRLLHEPGWLREGARALRSALKDHSLDEAVRILNQPAERVHALCDLYDSELSLGGEGLRADIGARLHKERAEVLFALLTRAGVYTGQARTPYVRQTAAGQYEKHQAIVAHPAVRVAVPGTQVRYSVAQDAALSSQGSYTTYRWLCLNDPQTSQAHGEPALVWGPQSASWDTRWGYPGNHKLICRVQAHFKEADGSFTAHAPEHIEYQQTVAAQGDVLAQAIEAGPGRAAPDKQLRFMNTYRQALRSAEQQPGSKKADPAVHEALDLRIARLGERLHSTDGCTRFPIRAVHVDAERAKVSTLNAFVARTAAGNGQETWSLVDITNPTDRRLTGEYTGKGKDALHAIKSAIAAWDSGNRYPKGRLRVKVPEEVGAALDAEFQTDGMGFWDSIAEFFGQVGFWSGMGMLGAAVAASIAPDPTVSKLAAVLLWTSILSGATGTSIGMIKRHAEHLSTLREDAMDVLSLASNALGAGWAVGATIKGLGFAGSRMGTAIVIGRIGTDGAQGILLSAEYLKEYLQILADPDPSRRTDRMIRLLESAALTGGLLSLSMVGNRADLQRGAAQRANLAKLGNAGESIELTPPHEGLDAAPVDPKAPTLPEIHTKAGAAPNPEQQTQPAPKVQQGAEPQKTPSVEPHAASSEARPRVVDPVPGLFDSIDTTENVAPPGWKFRDEIQPISMLLGIVRVQTDVVGPNGQTGWIKRTVHAQKQMLIMEAAFLDELPRWIDAGVPLRPDRGTPTVTYLTLRQMKMANGHFGGLKSVKMSTIQNFETLLQIKQLTDAKVPLDEAVKQTHSVQYAMTSIQQSGHKVLAVRVEIDPNETFHDQIGRLMYHRETQGRTAPRDPALVTKHDELLKKYGMSRTDIMMINFNIYFDLAPVTPSTL